MTPGAFRIVKNQKMKPLVYRTTLKHQLQEYSFKGEELFNRGNPEKKSSRSSALGIKTFDVPMIDEVKAQRAKGRRRTVHFKSVAKVSLADISQTFPVESTHKFAVTHRTLTKSKPKPKNVTLIGYPTWFDFDEDARATASFRRRFRDSLKSRQTI